MYIRQENFVKKTTKNYLLASSVFVKRFPIKLSLQVLDNKKNIIKEYNYYFDFDLPEEEIKKCSDIDYDLYQSNKKDFESLVLEVVSQIETIKNSYNNINLVTWHNKNSMFVRYKHALRKISEGDLSLYYKYSLSLKNLLMVFDMPNIALANLVAKKMGITKKERERLALVDVFTFFKIEKTDESPLKILLNYFYK